MLLTTDEFRIGNQAVADSAFGGLQESVTEDANRYYASGTAADFKYKGN